MDLKNEAEMMLALAIDPRFRSFPESQVVSLQKDLARTLLEEIKAQFPDETRIDLANMGQHARVSYNKTEGAYVLLRFLHDSSAQDRIQAYAQTRLQHHLDKAFIELS
jgi:hypothetical protein